MTLKSMDTDERGNAYTTGIVEFVDCHWCGGAIPVRAKGRRPTYCSPQCRVGHHRAKALIIRRRQELAQAIRAERVGIRADYEPEPIRNTPAATELPTVTGWDGPIRSTAEQRKSADGNWTYSGPDRGWVPTDEAQTTID